jgi:hypothetical protein
VFFLDPLNGGAWPLLVGGVICLVDSVNGRDPICPVEAKIFSLSAFRESLRCFVGHLFGGFFSAGFLAPSQGEILGNSRSVMLLNVLGYTRTTMSVRTSFPIFVSDPLDSIERGITGITSTQLGPRIAIIGRATRNAS